MPPSWVTYHPALNRWVQRERTQTAAPKRDSSSGRRRRPDELSIKSAFGQNGVQANFLCCTTSPLREVKMRTSQEMFAQPRIAANRRDGWEILSRDCLSMALPRGVQILINFAGDIFEGGHPCLGPGDIQGQGWTPLFAPRSAARKIAKSMKTLANVLLNQ